MDDTGHQRIFDFEAVFEIEDYLHFYRDVLTGERTDREVEFLERELELAPGIKVLDVACGFGRHSNRLAALGCEVTGVDLFEDFLAIARAEAGDQGLSVRYIREDMRKISFEREFDRALLLFTSFGYFSDEENLRVLENIAGALKPGGRFCMDSWNRDALHLHIKEHVVTEKGGDLMIDRNSFESLTGVLTNRRMVIREGRRKDKIFSIRFYNLTEMNGLLSRAGLALVKVFGGWDGSEFKSHSRTMLAIAERR